METKFIWKGAVGAQIKRKINSKTKEAFYTIAPVRCYKVGNDWKYAHDFTDEQLETLVNEVIPEARTYRKAAIVADKAGDKAPTPTANGFETGAVPLARIHVVKVPADQAIIG